MKYSDIEPGLYWVKPEKKKDNSNGQRMVYRIDEDAEAGTRFKSFSLPGFYQIVPNTAKIHIRATKIDPDTQEPDPWSTAIYCRNIIEPFTFPAVTKGDAA